MKEPRPRDPAPAVRPALRVPEPPVDAERLRAGRLRWHEAPALSERVLRQWWGNVRMRWNCHSNAIEGGSLSYADTLAVLSHGRTPANGWTRLLDVDQMRGHNESVQTLARLLNRGHVLRIDDLHAAHDTMLVRPYPAYNALGQVVGWVALGRFKTRPNSIRSDDRLQETEFQPPDAVPRLMPELLERMNQRIDILAHDPAALDPAWALASLHWAFIAIHPYDDGNGRMARWLVNWMSMNAGYPPPVITLDQRDAYFRTLSAMQPLDLPADEATVRPLRDFLAARLDEALAFATAVAEGRTDPTWDNEDADPRRPYRESSVFPVDATVPWIRTRDRPGSDQD